MMAENDLSEICIPDENQIVAMDCEFVGVGQRRLSALGRCSIVDFNGTVICDIYSKPDIPVTDYRTKWSGLRESNLRDAMTFKNAQEIIFNILKDKVVVGHAIFNDFAVLDIKHPRCRVRDTIKCNLLNDLAGKNFNQKVSLKRLSKTLLGRKIQRNGHCSVEDALASLDLYKLVRDQWEKKIAKSSKKRKKKVQSS